MPPSDQTPATQDLHAQARRATAGGRAASALHAADDWATAVDGALAALEADLAPQLAVVFADSRFENHYAAILDRVAGRFPAAEVIGCSGQSVLGSGLEAEGGAAVSVLALELPGATLTPLRVDPETTTPADFEVIERSGAPTWFLFADPFSINTDNLVQGLQQRHPSVVLLGGMASAHNNQDGTAIFSGGRAYASGAALLGVAGLEVHPIVAQGAEPLGQPWTITDCEDNIVRGIGGRAPVEVLVETLQALDPATQARAQQNLLVGLAMDEYAESHGRGSYLIRNIMGANRDEGWIAINAVPRVGQTFQFQFRDAAAADEDLRAHLSEFQAELGDREVLGALCCSCNGRGVGLFRTPHHDAAALARALSDVPSAGFFCNGEIGPVGGRNFLHGFTASIAVLTTPPNA